MLDFNASEFLVVAIVALIFIGPKDLPKALRVVGKWVGRARRVANQFRAGLDTMIRESELADLEKQWAAENERIMREHPVATLPAPEPEPVEIEDGAPVMVEKPAVKRRPRAKAVAVEAPVVEPRPKRARKPKAEPAQDKAAS